MTQVEEDVSKRKLVSRKVVVAILALLVSFAGAGNGMADEHAKAAAVVQKIKKQPDISAQQRMEAIQQYLHRLPEEQLVQLTQEIGGERFLRTHSSQNVNGKMNQNAKREAAAKMHTTAKMNGLDKGVGQKSNQAQYSQSLREQEIQAQLRDPQTRQRYLSSVAGFLFNTTK